MFTAVHDRLAYDTGHAPAQFARVEDSKQDKWVSVDANTLSPRGYTWYFGVTEVPVPPLNVIGDPAQGVFVDGSKHNNFEFAVSKPKSLPPAPSAFDRNW
jgi:hypothetical protein